VKFLQTTFLLSILWLLSSCDPIQLDTVDDEPEFQIEMMIDDQNFVFEAGNEDYFMQTEVVLLGPTIYSGSLLKKVDGQLIDDELAMTISFQIGELVHNSIDLDHINSFEVGMVPYNTRDDAALPVKEVVFGGDYEGTGNEVVYEWDYGDGEEVSFSNPIHAYPEIATYIATLKTTDSNGCVASTSNTVRFDNEEDCEVDILITNVSSSNAVLETQSKGEAPLQYLWSNGSTSEGLSIDITNASGVQEHCVTVTDANGCISVNCIGVVNDASGINTCSASMTETTYTRAATAKQFNSVEISWRDAMGEEYSSREVLQPSDSFFEIISFEEFDMNAIGERTVKIEFEFSCTLYLTGGTDPIQIQNAKGAIAVAIR